MNSVFVRVLVVVLFLAVYVIFIGFVAVNFVVVMVVVVVVVVVVEYCCFFIIFIVGSPLFLDPVLPLKYTQFFKMQFKCCTRLRSLKIYPLLISRSFSHQI